MAASATSKAKTTQFWHPTSYKDNKYAYVTFDKAYTLNELKYMEILCEVLAKPNWWTKMNDASILAKWKTESQLSDNDFAHLEAELKDIAQKCHLEDPNSTIPISLPVHGVFMTDALKGSPLVQDIRSTTAKLEDEARARGDYHPNSNNQVLDIVHPSLYCAVNGRTRISHTPNALVGDQVLEWPAINGQDISSKFQWLPTPVKADAAGNTTFESYINNIHPKDHADIYPALESLLTKMVPLFERSLGSLGVAPVHRIAVKDWETIMPLNRHETAKAAWVKLQKEQHPDLDEIDEDSDEFYEFLDAFDDSNVVLNIPEMPTTYQHFQEYPRRGMNGTHFQVIVKIASIELTPENPKYPGGSWHIEGMTNESIAATGILYYDCENITTSKLAFRHAFSPPFIEEIEYEQNEHAAITGVYGISSDGDDNLQVVGHIQAQEGRCVVFPNFMQHCVAPFELADATKPGHRKIVCFFLVNPDNSILSTANVPPQQATWSLRSLAETLSTKLPDFAIDKIQDIGGKMTHDEAKQYMLELMEERKQSSVFANYVSSHISLW
ncbi:hypothetical protein LEN26_019936 [Aphanomyces euteiches]|nr:hypothetical protein LEN26_019936 [Aphanomyces euteiches]KAH9111787.1 hypothetical protein AeMF1_013780 [Aphanomyces euteiches]